MEGNENTGNFSVREYSLSSVIRKLRLLSGEIPFVSLLRSSFCIICGVYLSLIASRNDGSRIDARLPILEYIVCIGRVKVRALVVVANCKSWRIEFYQLHVQFYTNK